MYSIRYLHSGIIKHDALSIFPCLAFQSTTVQFGVRVAFYRDRNIMNNES